MTRTPKAIQRALAESRPLTVEEGRKLFRPPPASEHAEQAQLMVRVRQAIPRYPDLANLTAVPNAEQSRAQAGKKWAEGVEPGYPDLLLDVARGGYFGLRLEQKKSGDWNHKLNQPYARGLPTDAQLDWHRRLRQQGYCVAVCWGSEPAYDVLMWYLTLARTVINWGDLREDSPTTIQRSSFQ